MLMLEFIYLISSDWKYVLSLLSWLDLNLPGKILNSINNGFMLNWRVCKKMNFNGIMKWWYFRLFHCWYMADIWWLIVFMVYCIWRWHGVPASSMIKFLIIGVFDVLNIHDDKVLLTFVRWYQVGLLPLTNWNHMVWMSLYLKLKEELEGGWEVFLGMVLFGMRELIQW